MPAPPGARTFLTKHPGDLIRIGPILRFDPDLYVIYMLRDPRDTVTSKHKLAPDRYWASLRYWKAFAPIGRKLRSHPRFVTVRYEDFVSDPDRVQQKLEEVMPFLVKRAPFSRYHEVAQPSTASLEALRGVRPIASVSVGKWRDHLPRLAGQIQLHGPIASDLIEFEYEENDKWVKELEGVKPDLSPSHWSEYFSRNELRRRKKGRYKEVAKMAFRRLGIDLTAMRAALLK